MPDKLIIACAGGEQTLYVGKVNAPHPNLHLPIAGQPMSLRDAYMIKTMYLPAQNEKGNLELVQKIQVVPIGFASGGTNINIVPTWVTDPAEDEKGMNKLIEHVGKCKESLMIESAKDAGIIVPGSDE